MIVVNWAVGEAEHEKEGQKGVHKGTHVLQFPERFTPRRLHTRPYASRKCLPCVRIPPVVPRDQSWA